MNVHELMTSLCPSSLCDDERKDFSPRTFVSDLRVVVGYSVLPQEIASAKLPSLEGGWNGFGAHQQPEDFEKELGQKLRSTPRTHFINEFIASSGGGTSQLDFIHVLLPHAPYEFFPSGRLYNSTRYQLGAEGDVWGDNQDLIDLDYQRYMLQVGLLDRKLGELVAQLKEKGVYDDALIVITADHGRSFTRNRPLRRMTDENAEVLHVPLFIKRPGQKDGQVSEAPASTLDILPTIAAELGIDYSWNLDGASLFAGELKGRERVSLSVRDERFDFSWDEVVRLPLLDWQARTFTLRKPLDEVTINNRYSKLIGSDFDPHSWEIASDAPKARLLQNLQPLTNVDLKIGFLPAVIDSEIVGEVSSGSWILAALNGKVAAVAQVYEKDEATKYVSALLPERLFREGSNSLEVYFLLEGEDGSRRLAPIEIEASTFEVNADRTSITSSRGSVHPIANEMRFGIVDIIRADGGSLRVSGWSIDTNAKRPVETVVIFSDGKFICATSPRMPRPDVAKAYKSPEANSSGFSIVCPIHEADAEGMKLKIYGINGEGRAAELHLPRA
ncbi:sulfatase-like hydrolase/transferase [Aminobacter sp. J44]|uniref:sulfatase-like hydrolase/transferase n=1 Tax=Aminobacter sp. J44 TaxID=935262 RepID=UPI00119BC978|nr:sulfatase-like hydrolase/transferase [Aminobacter sp. J44]TWG63521.1 Arylsulfatase A and related enzymes [Aminobacter sp. J44]